MTRRPSAAAVTQWLARLETQLDFDRLMEGCCHALMELTGADRCSIMILDTDTEELAVRWAQGVRVKPAGQRLRFRVGEGLCGWVARSQKPLCSFDALREHRYLPHPRPGRQFRPVRAICCVPLVTEGRTVGVVNLSSFSHTERFRWVRQKLSKQFLGRLAQVIAQATLLHEAQAASQRWQRMMKATSNTVAQVSHEVRTPLALILESCQQMLDGLGGPLPSKQADHVTLIKTQAGRMLKLVTELLDLSRIEAGRFALRRQPMDLGEVLQEVRTRYRPLVTPRRLHVQLDMVSPVFGDRERLTQVVENLLTNAVKYTPPRGAITMGLAVRGRFAELRVTDTGIGIAKRDQRRLFEKFFQPRIPVSLAQRGTGLGLAIVKEIVNLHGGGIRVASDPGTGTTFTVSVPLYTAAFALTEEFRAMREQAAREGEILAGQVFQAEPGAPVSWPAIMDLLQRSVARGDAVLEHPRGGLIVLSVVDRPGLQAMRRRLEQVLRAQPVVVPPAIVRWGCVMIPEEETELAAALQMAERRAMPITMTPHESHQVS